MLRTLNRITFFGSTPLKQNFFSTMNAFNNTRFSQFSTSSIQPAPKPNTTPKQQIQDIITNLNAISCYVPSSEEYEKFQKLVKEKLAEIENLGGNKEDLPPHIRPSL